MSSREAAVCLADNTIRKVMEDPCAKGQSGCHSGGGSAWLRFKLGMNRLGLGLANMSVMFSCIFVFEILFKVHDGT